jgi:hypothetical protein
METAERPQREAPLRARRLPGGHFQRVAATLANSRASWVT